MNKIVLGLLVGALLGAIDGGTAWFTPAVRPAIVGIIIGSTFKGLLAGVAAGIFARKVNSVPLGIMFGLAVGFILLFRDYSAGKHRWGVSGMGNAAVWHAGGCSGSRAIERNTVFFRTQKYSEKEKNHAWEMESFGRSSLFAAAFSCHEYTGGE
jgi:hypothetical protein